MLILVLRATERNLVAMLVYRPSINVMLLHDSRCPAVTSQQAAAAKQPKFVALQRYWQGWRTPVHARFLYSALWPQPFFSLCNVGGGILESLALMGGTGACRRSVSSIAYCASYTVLSGWWQMCGLCAGE